jgi:TonB family protein
MRRDIREVYSPVEIAQAAGVPVERVVSMLGRTVRFVGHEEAARVGRALRTKTVRLVDREPASRSARPDRMFTTVSRSTAGHSRGMSFALSGSAHLCLIVAAVLLTSFGLSPAAATLQATEEPRERVRLVFLATPGPGGGGGGGGLRQRIPAPKALKAGRARVDSPVPARRPPRPIEPIATPPEPIPPTLHSEPLPVLAAPIVSAPANARDRLGVLEPSPAQVDSHGPGTGGGAGAGAGTGLGPGSGPGVGPGSDGGTGGGPFRPGSGIDAPRLLREVKADYTEDARRRGVEGEVVMEIVVSRTGSVGDIRILQRLGAGLDERAAQAVRQWRFAPATRKGVPVDVLVEVGVEFRLR